MNIKDDLAYKHSIANNDIVNMQIVLRAHNLPHTFQDAVNEIDSQPHTFQDAVNEIEKATQENQ